MSRIIDFVRWFSGGERQFMPSLHCMNHNWETVSVTVALCAINTVGYFVIARHWKQQAKSLADGPAKTALMRLRAIFILCAMCGYVWMIVKMWWPAWRLYDIVLAVLAVFTWMYALNTAYFRVIFSQLGSAEKLASDVDRLENEVTVVRAEQEKKRIFLNAISHDLRTPLNAISLQAQLAQVAVHEGNYSDINEALSVVFDNAQAAAGMLNNLLDFARLQGEVPVAMDVHRLSDIMLGLARTFDNSAQKKGLYFKVPLATEIVLRTDRTRLERVLNNLVDNALKFTKRGGVTVQAESNERDVRIVIRDTGTGIDKSHRERLFSEFFQANNHERNRDKGFGLGLTIAKSLIESIGGKITLAHSDGNGSAFAIEIFNAVEAPADCGGRCGSQTRTSGVVEA